MKKYKLLKDLPYIKAGIIYEQDWNQYKSEKQDWITDYLNKNIIENNPEWFEEIKEEPKQINFSPPKKLIPLAKQMAETNTPADNSANASLRIGSAVEHEKFGIGEITFIEGVYPNAKATIKFRDSGEKNLLLKYAKLKVVM